MLLFFLKCILAGLVAAPIIIAVLTPFVMLGMAVKKLFHNNDRQ